MHNVSRCIRVMQQAYCQCQHGRIVASEKLFYVAICRHTPIKTATIQKPNLKSEKKYGEFSNQTVKLLKSLTIGGLSRNYIVIGTLNVDYSLLLCKEAKSKYM